MLINLGRQGELREKKRGWKFSCTSEWRFKLVTYLCRSKFPRLPNRERLTAEQEITTKNDRKKKRRKSVTTERIIPKHLLK